MNKLCTITFLLSIGFLFGTCSRQEANDNGPHSKTAAHSAHAQMQTKTSAPTDLSVYNLKSTWNNRYGHGISLDSLQGKIQVLAMLYTHCDYACPRITADMKRIHDSLSKKALQKTNFVMVTIDPVRDTPQRLRHFARENSLNETNWTLLQGAEGDILELAALLGFKYKRLSKRDFTHSNLITVLNEKGEIIYQRNRLTDNPSETVKKIDQALSD